MDHHAQLLCKEASLQTSRSLMTFPKSNTSNIHTAFPNVKSTTGCATWTTGDSAMSNPYRNDMAGWASGPPSINGTPTFDDATSMYPEAHTEMDLGIESCEGMAFHGHQEQLANWNRHAFASTGSHLNAVTSIPNELSANGWSNQRHAPFPDHNPVSMFSNTHLAANPWNMSNSTDVAQNPSLQLYQQVLATSSMPWEGRTVVPAGSLQYHQYTQSVHHAHSMLPTTADPFSGSQSMAWGNAATDFTTNTAFRSIHVPTHPAPVGNLVAASPAHAENPQLAASPDSNHGSTTVSTDDEEEGSELVCFGMLTGITGTCNGPANPIETLGEPLDVKLDSPEKFVEKEGVTTAMSGVISPDSLYLTTALLDEKSLRLQVRCNIVPEDRAKVLGNGKRLRVSRPALTRCTLDIILYGPRRLFSVIGEFIDECNEHLQDDQKLYLQDPVSCDENVRYCNPHRLPPLDSMETQFTFTLAENRQCFMDLEDFEPRPELLELLESQEDLPEAPQPPSIKTLLERHQKQALAFMLRREQGWDYSGTRPDIWEAIEDGRGHCFVNRVSDARQAEEPPPFSGGIIADPMGFGKTLSMIALIASHDTHLAHEDAVEQAAFAHEEFSRPTLVIVPPALLGTWEQELTTHVTPGMLPWRLHHGKTRLTEASELEQTALVLTTYHTVSLEGRSSGSSEASLLFSTRWRRVVLDEAHFIRNSERQMARAVCSLKAVSRWAVTGTPIQNHISDLSALLKFLAVYPYSEKRVFEADISQPWKSGNGDEAVKRLKRLAGCLLLRRPRKVVQLPPRHDHAINIDFNPEERLLYNQVRMQAVTRLAQMESAQRGDNHVDPKAAPISFVNVLQQIEAMRMVCNLGLLYPSRHGSIDKAQNEIVQGSTNWSQTAQRAFSLRLEMGVIQCHSCSFVVDGMTLPRDDEPTQPIFTQCLKFFCSSCVQTVESTNGVNKLSCDHTPTCPMALVQVNLQTLEEPLPVPVPTSRDVGTYMPTKIKALIQDIERLDKSAKCVVFSNWRMTLNVVKAGLDKAKISSLRFDGQVPHRERQGVLDRFRSDPSITVLLLTLSCGAVGLTLTNATRAYLMEPHWNPTIEDQALARIHRIGQKQEVTTIRFYVRDSFEENVVKNQESKRALASILLGSSGSAVPGDKEYLDHLRSLI